MKKIIYLLIIIIPVIFLSACRNSKEVDNNFRFENMIPISINAKLDEIIEVLGEPEETFVHVYDDGIEEVIMNWFESKHPINERLTIIFHDDELAIISDWNNHMEQVNFAIVQNIPESFTEFEAYNLFGIPHGITIDQNETSVFWRVRRNDGNGFLNNTLSIAFEDGISTTIMKNGTIFK